MSYAVVWGPEAQSRRARECVPTSVPAVDSARNSVPHLLSRTLMYFHPAEDATIRAFVRSARRERLVGLLANPKRRRKAVDALNHFHDWDPRWEHPVASTTDVVRLLRDA